MYIHRAMCRNAASFESNALSAAWAQRQLEPRASRIHDETDTARYIRGSIGFLCLVEMEALGTRPKVARKREPVATPPLQTSEPPVSSPALQSSLRAHRRRDDQTHPGLRVPNHHCSSHDSVKPAKCPNWSVPGSPCARFDAPVDSFAHSPVIHWMEL